MKSQVLHTVWRKISGEAVEENWSLSLLGVKGLIGRDNLLFELIELAFVYSVQCVCFSGSLTTQVIKEYFPLDNAKHIKRYGWLRGRVRLFTRLSAAALIEFSMIRVRRLFKIQLISRKQVEGQNSVVFVSCVLADKWKSSDHVDSSQWQLINILMVPHWSFDRFCVSPADVLGVCSSIPVHLVPWCSPRG